MKESQEQHLKSIIDDFTTLVDAKYRKGAEEHGGNLQDVGVLTLIDYALEEAVDQVVYLLTLKQALLEVVDGSLHGS